VINSHLIRTALARGARKRCPHCGQGALFEKWGRHLDRCSHCGLIFERNPGDTWFFTIVGDRIPVGAVVILIYFGVARSHPLLGAAAFAAMFALLLWTAPNRWGVGIALHYLSRAYSEDPDDPIPQDPSLQPPASFQ
jgi:uncharacterized protein (DUF983 family)